jgi:outer membrane protein assembly factor BamB
LNCLAADNGKVLWSRDLKEASGAKIPMWAFVGSPLVADDLVIVYAGGELGKGLLAYRIQSGDLAWTAPAGMSSYSSPQVTCIAGISQCLMLHDSGLTAVEVARGKKLWETGVIMKGAPRCGQPRLVDGNKLLVGALGGLGCSLVEVSQDGEKWVVTNKWDSKELKPEFPDFVVCDRYAYGFDIGIFCCLRLADGKRTWKEGRYGRGQVMLLRDQGLLLVSSETGELVLLAADPKEHREVARFQALAGKTWNHPVVVNDWIYLRNGQEMACYSISGEPDSRIANAK